MNRNLSNIEQLIEQSVLTDAEKQALLKEVAGASKQWDILEFKLERTEQVKQTTGVLLEETIEELEQKRKAVEEKNRDLEIESSLERVRTVAMGMRTADDLLNICQILFDELIALGFGELRKAMINIVNDEKGSFLNYDFNGSNASVTPFLYNSHPVMERQVEMTRSANDAFFEHVLTGADLEDFKAFRIKNGEFSDPKLENISALYYYFYSIGVGSLGISAFTSLSEEKRDVLKRFRNVFDLAYRRYADIQLAEAQAREAQIELALERVRARTMAMQHSEELAETAFILFQQFKELGENPDQATIGIINEEEHVIEYWVTMYGSQINKVFKFSIDEPNVTHKIYTGWKAHKKSLVIDLRGKALLDFATYRQSMGGARLNKSEKRRVINVAFFSRGIINVQSHENRSEESIRLLERFAGVFEGTYTRFLDLKRAEAQGRESQIELALERVRARTMAMQHSDELAEASFLLDSQVRALGIETRGCAFNIYGEGESTEWFSSEAGTMPIYKTPREGVFLRNYESGQRGESLRIEEFTGDACKAHYEYLCTLPVMGDALKKIPENGGSFPEYQIDHVAYFKFGYLLFITYEPVSEAHGIFIRFAKVFEQTYTRFLDLQKAEAQAHESQIQLALERVRARTMAMHHSEELADTASVLFEQIKELGFETWSCGFCIWKSNDLSEVWMAADSGGLLPPMLIPYKKEPTHRNIYEASLSGEAVHEKIWEGDELVEHYDFLRTIPSVKDAIAILENSGLTLPSRQCYYVGFFKQGYLLLITTEPKQGAGDLSKRFAGVFEQTYTRFLDLQKAEEQTKEAQLEAALEKVRSRSLAMHQTEELKEVVTVVFDKLHDLGIVMGEEAASIVIFTEGTKDLILWNAIPDQLYSKSFNIPYYDTAVITSLLDAKSKGADFFERDYTPEEKDHFWKWAVEYSDYKNIPDDRKRRILDAKYFACSVAYTKNSAILVSSYQGKLLSEKEGEILKRFARVFEQAYVRFLDLHKAEAQAKEAQIEASLERVRSRTMAMHNSQHVAETIMTMFDELVKLGIDKSVRCGIGIIDNSMVMEVWTAFANLEKGETDLTVGHLDMTTHQMLTGVFNNWKKGEQHSTYTLTGTDQEAYYRAINKADDYSFKFDIASLPEKQFQNAFYFREGFIYVFSHEQLTVEEVQIYKRFAGVFGLTYRRYLDLLNAEAQAREAQIEAGLERVRSRTMSMQKSDELTETAAVLFRQMIRLDVEPNRLYIGIIREGTTQIEFWITDEDGSKVSNMFSGDAEKNRSLKKMRNAWQEHKESIVIDMQGEELEEYLHYLGDMLHVPFKGGLEQKRRIQYISYFSNGFIGMASPDEQPQETIDLLDRFAYVFNLTYARFNDLKVAEKHAIQAEQDLIEIKAARKRAEDALAELRTTQTKLIQSEKMASLGELTAGIAHEIQNPLNFVNNFSEVNQEMIEELEEELKAGNIDEALAIAADIKGNEQKINHHGKRADGIVKGMLQHSRTGGGEKQPTNMNALADEFLRLSYHGLRAKDKSFNAEMITHFDPDLPKINVIPQDMGRVMLNLFNNAFYAVNQKMKTWGAGYRPEVSVTTVSENGQLLIKVKDNGTGMPVHIKEKIMQPFFTTKPTGEGTGLGLSLTYDMIVKGHGGSIQVNSAEGEGSEFVITLPLK